MAQVICVECNASVSDENDFCSECGFPFATLQPVTCPECGNKVVFSADACPVCALPYEKLIERLAPVVLAESAEPELPTEPAMPEHKVEPEADAPADEPLVAATSSLVAGGVDDPNIGVLPGADSAVVTSAEDDFALEREADVPVVAVATVEAVEVTPEEMLALSAAMAGQRNAEVVETVAVAEAAEVTETVEAEIAPVDGAAAELLAEMQWELRNDTPVAAEPETPIVVQLPVGGDLATQLEELHAEVLRLSAMVTNSEQLVAGLVDRVSAQHEEAVSRDLLSAVASELGGATARLEAGQKTLATDIAAQINKLKTDGTSEGGSAPEKPGELFDYLLYVALAILLFTVLNTFITAYLVRVVK